MKAGDKVVCISDDWSDVSPAGCFCPINCPAKGVIYLVIESQPAIDEPGVVLSFNEDYVWAQRFFRKIEPISERATNAQYDPMLFTDKSHK